MPGPLILIALAEKILIGAIAAAAAYIVSKTADAETIQNVVNQIKADNENKPEFDIDKWRSWMDGLESQLSDYDIDVDLTPREGELVVPDDAQKGPNPEKEKRGPLETTSLDNVYSGEDIYIGENIDSTELERS